MKSTQGKPPQRENVRMIFGLETFLEGKTAEVPIGVGFLNDSRRVRFMHVTH